jgi:hypothetical protein
MSAKMALAVAVALAAAPLAMHDSAAASGMTHFTQNGSKTPFTQQQMGTPFTHQQMGTPPMGPGQMRTPGMRDPDFGSDLLHGRLGGMGHSHHGGMGGRRA